MLEHFSSRWIAMDSRTRSQRTRIGKWFKEEENAERSRSLRRNSQWPVFKHCSLLVNCNRNLKTRPQNHLHGTSYLRLSEATNKAVLLNSALSSLKACCFCFLCSSMFLKPSIGMFLVVLFPSRSLSVPLEFYCCHLFVQSAHVAVSR